MVPAVDYRLPYRIEVMRERSTSVVLESVRIGNSGGVRRRTGTGVAGATIEGKAPDGDVDTRVAIAVPGIRKGFSFPMCATKMLPDGSRSRQLNAPSIGAPSGRYEPM